MSILYAIILKGHLLMTYRNSYLLHSQLANQLLQTPSIAAAGDTASKRKGLATRKAISARQTDFTDEEVQTLRDNSPVLNNLMRIQRAFQEGKPIQVADASGQMPEGDYTDTRTGRDFTKALMEGSDQGIEIMKGLMKKGYTPEVAAGFVGNMQHESGDFKFVQEQGVTEGKGGLGYAQWTAERRDDFEAFLKENNYEANSIDATVDFIHQELQGKEKSAYNKVKNLKDVEKISDILAKKYFRPQLEEKGGKPQYDTRNKYSVSYLDVFQSIPNFIDEDPYEKYYQSPQEIGDFN
jgi:hypothetical protein